MDDVSNSTSASEPDVQPRPVLSPDELRQRAESVGTTLLIAAVGLVFMLTLVTQMHQARQRADAPATQAVVDQRTDDGSAETVKVNAAAPQETRR